MYVYILECNDGSYYIGVTNDYERRFSEHQSGKILHCYTHERRPLKLVHIEEFVTITDAIKREKQLKRWSRVKKQALIKGDEKLLGRLSWNRSGLITIRRGSAGSP